MKTRDCISIKMLFQDKSKKSKNIKQLMAKLFLKTKILIDTVNILDKIKSKMATKMRLIHFHKIDS